MTSRKSPTPPTQQIELARPHILADGSLATFKLSQAPKGARIATKKDLAIAGVQSPHKPRR